MSIMLRPIAITLGLLLSAQVASAQPPADHMQCFNIADAATRALYHADLAPTDPRFPVASGCSITVPAKMLCVDVVKSNVTPTPPGSPAGDPAHSYLCYRTRCPRAQAAANVTDQFGVHAVRLKTTGLLCAPVDVPTTTTTTLPAASCVDAIRNGTETDIDCGGNCPPCNTGQQCLGGSDCAPGNNCSGGVCTTYLPNGSACSSDGECQSAFCVDGSCCDTSCSGSCRACSAAKRGSGTDGTCGNISAGSDPDSECSTSSVQFCGTSGTCSGAGSCSLYAAGTVCGAGSCSSGVSMSDSLCDGAGTCVVPGPQPCSPYVCGPSACKMSCSSPADCHAGYSCVAGFCQ